MGLAWGFYFCPANPSTCFNTSCCSTGFNFSNAFCSFTDLRFRTHPRRSRLMAHSFIRK